MFEINVKHSDNPKEYRRLYYLANKEKWKKYWKDANSRRIYIRGSYSEGKERYFYNKKQKDYGNKPEWYYKEKHRKNGKIWRKKNPESVRLSHKYRKARKRAGGKLDVGIVQRIYEHNIKHFGTLTCIYCIEPIVFGNDNLEHIIPLSRNGKNTFENMDVACSHCNLSKSNKLLEEWFPTNILYVGGK